MRKMNVGVLAICSEDKREGVSRQEGMQGPKWVVLESSPTGHQPAAMSRGQVQQF